MTKGRNSTIKLFKRLSEITDVKPSRATPYHPMGNGMCMKRMEYDNNKHA